MGTCSYVLTGTDQGFKETFGSTCHGAGRALSRAKSRRTLDYTEVSGSLPRPLLLIRKWFLSSEARSSDSMAWFFGFFPRSPGS